MKFDRDFGHTKLLALPFLESIYTLKPATRLLRKAYGALRPRGKSDIGRVFYHFLTGHVAPPELARHKAPDGSQTWLPQVVNCIF